MIIFLCALRPSWLNKPETMTKEPYKNILIIQTAFLGDVILLTPLIRAVKKLYPQTHIDVLAVPQSGGVLDNNPHLRRVLTFDKRRNKWRAFWQTLRRLRGEKYDLAISPHSSTTTALLMFLAGIPVRVGFDRWHAARYLTHKVPHYDDRGWHKVQKNLLLLSALTDALKPAEPVEAESVEAKSVEDIRFLRPNSSGTRAQETDAKPAEKRSSESSPRQARGTDTGEKRTGEVASSRLTSSTRQVREADTENIISSKDDKRPSAELVEAESVEAESVEDIRSLRQARGTEPEADELRVTAKRHAEPFPPASTAREKNPLSDIQTELFPSAQDEVWADEQLAVFATTGRPLIALAPGSVWNTKRWPKEHYIALSRQLCKAGYHLVFIGGPEERALCGEIIDRSGCRALNAAGNASILQSAALIGRCDLMICNDSGALHIANAMQTDVFAFFGPTVPSIGYYPFRPGDVVFEREMDCRPCGSHGGKVCPLQHHECMTLITPDEVLVKVKEKIPVKK